MKTLTKAEEEIMQVLWKLGKSFLRDITNEMPEPKPHQKYSGYYFKNFVGIEVVGRMHEYYALVNKDVYSKGRVKSLVKKYYEGSFSNIVSSMVKENNLSIEELEMLVKQLKKNK
jgi:BlaI family penicillinase repressor